MKTSFKNTSDTEVMLTVTLGVEELAIAEQVAAEKLARDVKVPGFRKGKAPLATAIKHVDPSVLQEQTINNAISKSISEAFLERQDIRALDRPMVEVKKFVPNESLEYIATVEILPTVKLGNYKKLKAKAEKVVVSKEEIDEVVERMQKGLGEKKEVGRAAKNGDEVIIDFVGKKDGVAFDGGSSTDYPLVLGSNQFIPGFEDGVVGKKAGETFDLDLEFPADYGSKELSGQKVVFSVTLKAVKEVVLAEINDEFAKKAGPFKTADEMLADIKRELSSQKERENNEKLKDQLITQLVDASDVPAPKILIEDQARSIEKDFTQNLMYQGLTLEQYLENKGFESREKWIEAEVNDIALKRVKSGLVLAELSKAEKIEATSEELEAQVEKFKTQYSKNPDVLKQFELPEVRRDIANRLITEKTVERLVQLNSK